jgi:hypothetical protein
MKEDFLNDNLIERYLLGELSDQEQTELEGLLLNNESYRNQITAIEKELIDEYVRGELPPTKLRNFQQHFLVPESRRRQVQFSNAFMKVAERRTVAGVPSLSLSPHQNAWQSLKSRFVHRPHFALTFSAVALLLVVIGGAFLLMRTSKQPGEEQAQHQATPQVSPSIQKQATPELTPEHRAQDQSSPSTNKPSEPLIASLLLLPGTSRSAENRPQLAIGSTTTRAQFRILIESGDEYPTYSVELASSNGILVRRQTGLRATATRAGNVVTMTVPSQILPVGNYELTLKGINTSQAASPIGYYNFRVVR